MKAKRTGVAKFSGFTNWTQQASATSPGCQVLRVILRDDSELVFDFVWDEWIYSVKLRRDADSDRFTGEFEATQGARRAQLRADCRVYSNNTGICLVGRWFEDDNDFMWWAEFAKVDRFDDEASPMYRTEDE